jgi:hypothetical protein
MDSLRLLAAFAVAAGVVGAALGSDPRAQGPTRPRPGLTAQQTKEAVSLTRAAMTELRKKTEGASERTADRREYIVGVELLSSPADENRAGGDSSATAGDEQGKTKPAPEKKKENDEDGNGDEKAKEKGKEKPPGTLAVVTWYRYFDDITVFSTVDLSKGKVVAVEAIQHLRTPLSTDEFEEAQELAREKSEEVKQLYERFGKALSAYPQFSQFTLEDDPRVNRVVHLTYRVGKRDLSYPRPEVNLTTRKVEVPRPESENEPVQKTKPRRPSE